MNRVIFGTAGATAIAATLYAPWLGFVTVPAAAALIAGLAMEKVRMEHGQLPNRIYAVTREEE